MNTSGLLTEDELRADIRGRAKKHGRQYHAAAAWNMSVGVLCCVINGHKRPGPDMLRALGYERVYMYRRIESEGA